MSTRSAEQRAAVLCVRRRGVRFTTITAAETLTEIISTRAYHVPLRYTHTMCRSADEGGRRCPCQGGTLPVPQTPEEREERAKFLSAKRGANASAADQYRQRQAVMVREARDLINSLDRVPDGERRAALTAALSDLPERGAVQPRRVLEEALSKSGGWTPVSEPVTEPEVTPDPAAVHADAEAHLRAIIAESRAAEDAEHATRVEAAREAVEGKTNPFVGLVTPESPDSPVSVDEAYRDHMAREQAEERAREEQEARDASPRRVKPVKTADPENPFAGWVTVDRLPAAPKPVNTADERARIEEGFAAFMAEVTAAQGVTPE